MKKTVCLCVLIFLLLMSFPAAAQWIKVYDFDSGVTGKKIIQTDDGGLFTAGSYSSDVWVSKMNIEGDIEWQYSFGGDKYESINCILQTSGGGYVVGGHTNSFHTAWRDKDLMLVKLSASGGIEWQQRYQVYNNATGGITSITEAPDHGYVFTFSASCDTCFWGSGTWNSYAVGVMKVDGTGNIVWQKIFRCGKYEDFVWDLLEVEGGYLLALEAISTGIVVLKMDYDGEIIWNKSYGQGAALQIEEAANGEFIIFANARWNKPIIRINSDGNVMWAFEYSGFYRGNYKSIYPTQDGGCLIAGQGVSGIDAIFLKIDQLGNVVYSREFSGSEDDRVNSVIELEDGRLAAVGQSRFFAPEDYTLNMWILTETEDGEMGDCPFWADIPISGISLPKFASDVNIILKESYVISVPTDFEVQETYTIANFLCGAPTPEEMIQKLIDDVLVLKADGFLHKGQANALISILNAALKSLEKGNFNAACNQLNAFINKVNALINSRRLSPEQGQDLIDSAQRIINALNE